MIKKGNSCEREILVEKLGFAFNSRSQLLNKRQLSPHSCLGNLKIGKLTQMQVGYGKIFLNSVQKITARKRCHKSCIEA